MRAGVGQARECAGNREKARAHGAAGSAAQLCAGTGARMRRVATWCAQASEHTRVCMCEGQLAVQRHAGVLMHVGDTDDMATSRLAARGRGGVKVLR